MKKKKLKDVDKYFDKYYYYESSVQSPDTDAKFILKVYKKLKGKEPKILREDFCGTHLISCEWVKMSPDFVAYGLDLDPETIEYGIKNHQPKLKENQRKRLHVNVANVLDKNTPKADIIVAPNFSYFLFKKRQELKAYFQNAHDHLLKDGVFILDCFGGSQCQEPNEEETQHKTFSYFWDQESFNPITNEAVFCIHFKRKGEKKRERVFVYDWRMWSIAEMRDILDEVGFKKTTVYWEGTDKDGEGDGKFKPSEKGEDCEAWIAYIAAEK